MESIMLEHYQRLERMFHSAPVQTLLPGATMQVTEGKAVYTLPISEAYFHAAEAMHGAIYFKLLDDAAYFAAATLETEYFVLTKIYEIAFKRPVGVGLLRAEGEVITHEGKEIKARSRIYNESGKVVGEGTGIFVKGPKPLMSLEGYAGNLNASP